MIAKIEQLLKEVEALHASNAEELEALRIKYLSKKGAINDLMADFRNVAAEQKKEVGMRLNELKTKAQDKINALKEQFESQDNSCDGLDLTRSAYPIELGTRHPITIVKNEVIDIFASLIIRTLSAVEQWHRCNVASSSFAIRMSRATITSSTEFVIPFTPSSSARFPAFITPPSTMEISSQCEKISRSFSFAFRMAFRNKKAFMTDFPSSLSA